GLNPGLIKTNIRSNYMGAGSLKHRLSEWFIGLVMMNADDYAARIAPVALAADLTGRSPVCFNQKGAPIEASAVMRDGYAARYLAASEKLIDGALTASPPRA